MLTKLKGVYKGILPYRLGVFLCFCILLGGTSQYIVSLKTPIYLVSIILIAHSFTSNRSRSDISVGLLSWCGIFILLLFLIYACPLPPSIWTDLPGRNIIQTSFNILNLELPWMPISLSPEITRLSLLDFLPPAAVFIITVSYTHLTLPTILLV